MDCQQKFINRGKEAVVEYTNEMAGSNLISIDDVFVVWSCKTLQNSKALLANNTADHLYFELTYNGDKDEIYFDVYNKVINKAIKP